MCTMLYPITSYPAFKVYLNRARSRFQRRGHRSGSVTSSARGLSGWSTRSKLPASASSLFFFFLPSFIRRRSTSLHPLSLPPLLSPISVNILLFFLPDPRLHCCLSSPLSPAMLLSLVPSKQLSHFHLLSFSLFTFLYLHSTSCPSDWCRPPLCVPNIALVTTRPLQDFRMVEMRSYDIVAFFSLRRDDMTGPSFDVQGFFHLLDREIEASSLS